MCPQKLNPQNDKHRQPTKIECLKISVITNTRQNVDRNFTMIASSKIGDSFHLVKMSTQCHIAAKTFPPKFNVSLVQDRDVEVTTFTDHVLMCTLN